MKNWYDRDSFDRYQRSLLGDHRMSLNLGGYNGVFGLMLLVLIILAIVYFVRRV